MEHAARRMTVSVCSEAADRAATRRARQVLGRLGVGEHFGAKNIVDANAPREVDVQADTPLACLTLDHAGFGELLELVQHSLARELANRRWILENRNKVRSRGPARDAHAACTRAPGRSSQHRQ